MVNNENYQNWSNLVLFTKEFKEWIWKLIRKIHARIGHVEKELILLKKNINSDYWLIQNSILEDGKIKYDLVEKTTGEIHGSILFDTSGGIYPAIWNDEIEPIHD